jgi:hypothetical protein
MVLQLREMKFNKDNSFSSSDGTWHKMSFILYSKKKKKSFIFIWLQFKKLLKSFCDIIYYLFLWGPIYVREERDVIITSWDHFHISSPIIKFWKGL